MPDRVKNPLIELLAIKLYEHDAQSGYWPGTSTTSWMKVSPEDRDIYRKMAAGDDPLDE